MHLIYLFLCFYYIFGIKCENNDLSDEISNPVLFSNRKNYVLFIFYENTTITIEKFKTLLGTFIEMEEEGDCKNNNKTATIRFPCSWKTFVQFGNGNETFPNLTSFEFENSIGVNELMDNAEYLFNASKVQNPESQIDNLMNDIVSETTEFALQRFVIIVSDQCFSDSLSGNPRFGTESLSMLMLQNDSKKCYSNWPIFIPENITASIQIYSNMDVQYSANPNTTIINFIAVIYKNETIFDFVLNLIKKRILSKESLCRNRKFIGAFQIGSNDKKSQKVFTIALPLYFNDDETEWYFEYNLKRAFNNAKVIDFNDETCFQSYLLNAKSGRDFNQTIIFYIDSIPSCINLNTFWNKTNQHLEVIVHGKLSDAEYNQTLTFIAPDQYKKSNHWSLFDSDDNFEKFAYYNTICRNDAPSYILMPSFPTTAASSSISYSNTPSTISSSPTIMTTTVSVLHTSTKVWWIAIFGVGAVILLSTIAAILYRCHRKKQKQRRQFFYKKDIQLKVVATAFEATLSNAFVNDERQKAYINKDLIQIDQNTILGKGSNAIVYSANFKGKFVNHKMHTLRKNDEASNVAVKILTVSNNDMEEFVRELDALLLIGSHSNIITFYGWTLQEKIPVIITELAETDLLQYVRKLRDLEFPLKQILSILWQIALALEHIASLSMVHRDVACRNILLTKSGSAKLADFGLCCNCDESFTYRASLQKRLPLKWLSIEALIDRIFSEKSDVWSFGVLCYETFSSGLIPYPALSNVEMLEFLQSGKRLEKPSKASNEIYDLMLKCWSEKPEERPSFKDLSKELKIILENETQNYGYLTLNFV